MKIDFRKVNVKDVEGNKSTVDIAKELGNQIYKKTADLGELETAREIYKNGTIEVDAEKATILSRYVKEGFLAFVQESICPVLERIINNQNKK
ncbi:MAG: hypothetical protein H6Q12_17 [Bacteroidetes bacterium]|nr:hypothetical protein [Bacteroidota bacterium]